MSFFDNPEETIKNFLKGNSLGLMVCSIILFFIHYEFNKYFNFKIAPIIVFLFWLYFILNSIVLFKLLKNNVFECPTCKRRHNKK